MAAAKPDRIDANCIRSSQDIVSSQSLMSRQNCGESLCALACSHGARPTPSLVPAAVSPLHFTTERACSCQRNSMEGSWRLFERYLSQSVPLLHALDSIAGGRCGPDRPFLINEIAQWTRICSVSFVGAPLTSSRVSTTLILRNRIFRYLST